MFIMMSHFTLNTINKYTFLLKQIYIILEIAIIHLIKHSTTSNKHDNRNFPFNSSHYKKYLDRELWSANKKPTAQAVMFCINAHFFVSGENNGAYYLGNDRFVMSYLFTYLLYIHSFVNSVIFFFPLETWTGFETKGKILDLLKSVGVLPVTSVRPTALKVCTFY